MSNQLRAYRALLGFNQEQMAERLSMTKRTYVAKELGYRAFKVDEMAKIKELVLEVDKDASIDKIFFNEKGYTKRTKS